MSVKGRKIWVVACTFLSLASLNAERNGAYTSVGFQYSRMAGSYVDDNVPTSKQYGVYDGMSSLIGSVDKIKNPVSGNLYGVDVQLGYKQFFGKKKHFGLRYYGVFSGQGGNYYGGAVANAKGSLSNLFYGAGIDVLLNFYENKEHMVGVFGGVMLGGSTWGLGNGHADGQCLGKSTKSAGTGETICLSMNKTYSSSANAINNQSSNKASFSANYVQFLFNFGLRANLSQHNGLELGVRIPVINDPFFKVNYSNGAKLDFSFRRVVAVFVNYVYNF
ncbi:outer membrane protein [Helicobacter salomonis]|uniref:outer membrane protein n=1 Tax=Helicobacter salomonis TaxID=56878 RepID=UPI000CF04364|nr:outer membrane protein [Helicobacter salomonis]